MTTTREGVDTDADLSTDEAANALLSRWTDAEQPSRDDEGAKPPRRDETTRKRDEDENQSESDEDLDFGDEDQQDDDDNDEGDAPVEASDDAVVKLTVDGEDIQIPVKDLKRLYGQEASLTRKSQEVAQKRQLAEDEGARYVVATQRLLDRANERFKPYSTIDWTIAAKTLDTEEYTALRNEATAAFGDVRFLNEELGQVFNEQKDARTKQLAEEAKAAVEVLQRDIPDFNADTYQAIANHAISLGLPQEAVYQLTDPIALKIIYESMTYRRAKERAATKRKTQPTSKRTMQSNRRPSGRVGDKAGEELKKLRQTGSRDDAVKAFMAGWETDGD
jgi:hypothetical protein